MIVYDRKYGERDYERSRVGKRRSTIQQPDFFKSNLLLQLIFGLCVMRIHNEALSFVVCEVYYNYLIGAYQSLNLTQNLQGWLLINSGVYQYKIYTVLLFINVVCGM